MKVIFLTMSATIAAISFATMLFLNSILGVFGLVATSVDTFNNLQASQQIVKKMKSRYQLKSKRVAKKLAKRSTRRIASASLAAATIGTVAVAVTMASFEVYDYCEDKKSLQDDFNILYGTNEKFNFEQCLNDGKNDSKRMLSEVKHSASESVFKAMNSTVKYSGEKWLAVKESTAYAFESTHEAMNNLWESTKAWLAE